MMYNAKLMFIVEPLYHKQERKTTMQAIHSDNYAIGIAHYI